tara:strand:+ start:83 stop:391 length:309 start_codon:yes stop_codon:yes gene_type:complete
MKDINRNSDFLNILREIKKDSSISQRKLAEQLNISLGKINYCLIALKQKGFIKINNFKKNKKKFEYLYLLTPRGILEKKKLTINFMKQKMREYDQLKKELDE